MNANMEKIAQLARMGAEFLAVPEEEATVRAIATKATEFVPECNAATVTILGRGGVHRLAASTGSVASEAERHQADLAEGPTFDTVTSGETTVVDLAQEARWPLWVERAHDLGLTGVMTWPLAAGNEQLGVLGVYSSAENGFSDESFAYAYAYCAHASVALFAARQASGLHLAVESRHRIGIAQGILMFRYSISKETAFQLLRRYSNATNTKLRDVATTVYELGDLPPAHRPNIPRAQYSPVPTPPRQRRDGYDPQK
jgi:GAF domain-containing protein